MRFVDVEQSLVSGGVRETASGEWLGVLPALWVAAAGGFVACLPVVLSPLLTMGDLPDELNATAAADRAPVGAPDRG